MIGQILYTTVEYFFNIVLLLILARIILSWLPQYKEHQIAQMVLGITEPILSPFQRIIPPMGMIDISPMVAIIALSVIQQVLLWVISNVFVLPLQ